MILRAAFTALALLLAMPLPALAQTDVIEPIPPLPCPWWDCGDTGPVVVEQYRVDSTIDGPIATTRITQVLRNDGVGLAEGRFLMPIPADAAVTGLTLWIDDEPVAGEILDGDAARRTYEQIVRETLDPALLEFVDDDLLSLSVFPIPAGAERTVEVEYRQVLAPDSGLVRYRQPMAREHHGVDIERVIARIEIIQPDGVKAVHSPTHAISLDRFDENRSIVGFEGEGRPDSDFVLYFSTDAEPVSLDVLSHRDGDEGWFLLLASPGLARSWRRRGVPPPTCSATSTARIGSRCSPSPPASRRTGTASDRLPTQVTRGRGSAASLPVDRRTSTAPSPRPSTSPNRAARSM